MKKPPPKKARRVVKAAAKRQPKAHREVRRVRKLAKIVAAEVDRVFAAPTIDDLLDAEAATERAETLRAVSSDLDHPDASGCGTFVVDPKLASAPIGTGLTPEETEAAISRVRDLEPLSHIRDDRMQERLANAAKWLGGDPERVRHFNEWRQRAMQNSTGPMTGLANDIQAGRVRLVETVPARRRWRLLDPAITLAIGALAAIVALGAGVVVGQVLARIGVVFP